MNMLMNTESHRMMEILSEDMTAPEVRNPLSGFFRHTSWFSRLLRRR